MPPAGSSATYMVLINNQPVDWRATRDRPSRGRSLTVEFGVARGRRRDNRRAGKFPPWPA